MSRMLPELRVEIDSRTPAHAWTPPPSWTVISGTNGITEYHERRGREYLDEEVRPAELLLTLKNTNGNLDPTYPASPYAGLLTPGRQLRVVYVPTGQVVFRGNVKEWPVDFGRHGQDVTVTLLVEDIFAELGRTALPSSLVEYELARGVKYPRPTHLFALREVDTGADVDLADSVSDWQASPVGTPAKPGGGLVPYTDIAGMMGGTPGKGGWISMPLAILPSPPWTMMAMVRAPEGKEAIAIQGESPSAPAITHRLMLRLFNGVIVPEAMVLESGSPNVVRGVRGPSALDDNAPHSIAMRTTGSALTIISDGVAHAAVSHGTIVAPTSFVAAGSPGCEFAFITIWSDEALATPALKAVHDDIFRPWAGDNFQQRMTKLLDLAAPGAERNITGTGQIMLPVYMKSRPSLDVLTDTVDSEDGRLWVDRAGVVQGRERSVSSPGAALRIYGSGGVPIRKLWHGRTPVVTHVVASNGANTLQVFHDTGASGRLGEHRLDLKGVTVRNPLALWLLAERRVFYGSRPIDHVKTIELVPGRPEVGFAETLSLDQYDRIDVAYRRRWDGAVITERSRVLGVNLDSEDGTLVAKVHLTPARIARVRMSVPNLAATGAATPDRAAVDVTGDIDIRARFWLSDWTKATAGLVCKGDMNTVASAFSLHTVGGNRGFQFRWEDAAGARSTVTATGALHFSGARPVWVRVTLKVASPFEVNMYTSNDGSEWRLVRTVSVAAATNIRNSAAALEIGRASDSAGANVRVMNGRMLYAEVRNGIDGPVVARFDPEHFITRNGSAGPPVTFSSDVGDQWTLQADSQIEAW